MINYFELYHLPISFHPDQQAVKKKFYELSRQYHPDRFVQGGTGAIEEALKMSSLNNEAFNTLKDPDATMHYVLRLEGVLEEEEKYALQPNFLMEMMELNEAVSEWELAPEDREAKLTAVQTLNDLMDLWKEEVDPLLQKFDQGDKDNNLLNEIKDYYFRKKYLLRIRERIGKFAAL